MNDWINTLTEEMGIGAAGLYLSLSDLSMLAPDPKILLLVGVAAVFCMVAGYQEIWFNHRQDNESQTDKNQDD